MGGAGQGNPADAPSLFLPIHPQNRKQSSSETIGVQRQKHTLYQNHQRLEACRKERFKSADCYTDMDRGQETEKDKEKTGIVYLKFARVLFALIL